MHNNYYFLRQLTKKLESTLSRTVISQCFTQNKEELVIQLETSTSPFFIKAGLSPQFSCLSFPTNFHRAKKNSADLFQPLIGQHIEGFRQFDNERSFSMNCSNQFTLLFKMHGNRSNLILFDHGIVSDVFKSSLNEDGNLKLETMDRTIDWSYEHFVESQKTPEAIYFTFGTVVWQYLKSMHFDTLPLDQQWQAIQQVRKKLENPNAFYIQHATGKVVLSLLDVGTAAKEIMNPVTAVTEFYAYYTQHDAFVREKASAMSALKSKLHSNENYLRKTEMKLRELKSENNYKVWADLLMANLHTISHGSTSVTLPDFQDNHPTEIKLKPDLSAQKNAAIFYKKGKNQQIEIDHLTNLIDNKKEESATLAHLAEQIEVTQNKKDLQTLFGSVDIENTKKKQVLVLPYREIDFNGYKIWIGRNAESNDTLTLKFGYKEDLWLHAKDVAGSHVLLKHQAGKKFPKDVIDRAAQLAAYYSKRKNESLCPVIVTPKKFVRKRKGDPPGVVLVEREEVVMVRPIGNRSMPLS